MKSMQHLLIIALSTLILLTSAKSKTKFLIEGDIEDKMWEEGLSYRPYSVKTEDGFILSVIHILPYDESFDTPEMRTRGTIVLGHGSMMDGLSWFET